MTADTLTSIIEDGNTFHKTAPDGMWGVGKYPPALAMIDGAFYVECWRNDGYLLTWPFAEAADAVRFLFDKLGIDHIEPQVND